eukprot:GHVR01108387.1.p1 GENE.GHVR01108387.1~~GHVR01108387.1.p1  ORF type:complete len:197 (+),score=47.10 GHVR01108387.1:62-652(+)
MMESLVAYFTKNILEKYVCEFDANKLQFGLQHGFEVKNLVIDPHRCNESLVKYDKPLRVQHGQIAAFHVQPKKLMSLEPVMRVRIEGIDLEVRGLVARMAKQKARLGRSNALKAKAAPSEEIPHAVQHLGLPSFFGFESEENRSLMMENVMLREYIQILQQQLQENDINPSPPPPHPSQVQQQQQQQQQQQYAYNY